MENIIIFESCLGFGVPVSASVASHPKSQVYFCTIIILILSTISCETQPQLETQLFIPHQSVLNYIFVQNALNVLKKYSSWLCVRFSKCELQSMSFITCACVTKCWSIISVLNLARSLKSYNFKDKSLGKLY